MLLKREMNYYTHYKGWDIYTKLRGPKDIEAFSIGAGLVDGYIARRRTDHDQLLKAVKLNDLKKIIREKMGIGAT